MESRRQPCSCCIMGSGPEQLRTAWVSADPPDASSLVLLGSVAKLFFCAAALAVHESRSSHHLHHASAITAWPSLRQQTQTRPNRPNSVPVRLAVTLFCATKTLTVAGKCRPRPQTVRQLVKTCRGCLAVELFPAFTLTWKELWLAHTFCKCCVA